MQAATFHRPWALLAAAWLAPVAAQVIPAGDAPQPAQLQVYQNADGQLIAAVAGTVPACGVVPQPGDPTFTRHDSVIDVSVPTTAISCTNPPPADHFYYAVINFGRLFDGTYTINWNAPQFSQSYAVSGNPGVDAAFSGNWYDPDESGHGFTLEVLPGNPRQLLAYWFVFAPGGGATWITGTGPITGTQAVIAAYQVGGSGAQFPPHFDPAHVAAQAWGTLTFTFSDCNTGHLDWTSTAPGYGSGSLPLKRLTQPDGLACP